MLCTRSNGLRPLATVVGTFEDGLLHLEYYQDGLRVVNQQCKTESISFEVKVKFTRKGPWSFTTATRTGKVPLKVLQSIFGRPILRVFPRGMPGGLRGNIV